jgi:hypothetical protein
MTVSDFDTVMALCVYPCNNATSIITLFVASIAQLVVTLQIILGASRRINELQIEVQDLKLRWKHWAFRDGWRDIRDRRWDVRGRSRRSML